MNSAEKKAPEPSMDDIISSIRNIIADDTQESAPAPQAESVEQAPPVVQLTESQIAQPVVEQGVEAAPQVAAPPPTAIVTPEPSFAPEPAVTDAFDSAQIANEIQAVPGLEVAADVPVVLDTPAAPIEALKTPVAPAIAAPEPTTPIDVVQPVDTPDVNSLMAAAPALAAPAPEVMPAPVVENIVSAPVAEPVIAEQPVMAPAPVEAVQPVQSVAEAVPQPMEDVPAPAAEMPVIDPAPALVDDIAFVSPEPVAVEPAPVAAAMSETVDVVDIANDPVEEMMQAAAAAPSENDTINNEIDPDQILEGIESPSVEVAAPVAPERETVSQVEPSVAEVTEEASFVLDASQVTPEDAAAITAVAAATSEAMAGTSEPEKKQGGNSLEDSIKEMMKPMIREWLDDNMPRILEGAIKEEVKKS